MKNVLLDKGIILPSGEINKDKINLVAGAITQPFAEMVEQERRYFYALMLRSRSRKSLDLCGFAGAFFVR